MKRFLLAHGPVVLLDVVTLVILALVLLARHFSVVPTVLFVLLLNVVYWAAVGRTSKGGRGV